MKIHRLGKRISDHLWVGERNDSHSHSIPFDSIHHKPSFLPFFRFNKHPTKVTPIKVELRNRMSSQIVPRLYFFSFSFLASTSFAKLINSSAEHVFSKNGCSSSCAALHRSFGYALRPPSLLRPPPARAPRNPGTNRSTSPDSRPSATGSS